MFSKASKLIILLVLTHGLLMLALGKPISATLSFLIAMLVLLVELKVRKYA